MSKREWKPGTVAMVSRGDGGPVIGFRDCGRGTPGWALGKHLGGSVWVAEGDVTDARPLVVIDPEDREQVERLIRLQDRHFDGSSRSVVLPEDLRDMQAALREFANPTPPKPVEPTGLGAVVEDDRGRRWVRRCICSTQRSVASDEWSREGEDRLRTYADIAAVRVLSEGVGDV